MKHLEFRPNPYPGLLVTFCGLDGSGKSTLLRRLAAELEGKRPVLVTKQPTDAVRRADGFRAYMDTPAPDVFDYRAVSLQAAGDRLQHGRAVIEPALREGKVVLCDRYFYSCLANLRARGYTGDRWIYEIAESVLRPDIAFFCDVPVELAVARVRQRPEERCRYIDLPLQYKLRSAFLNICESNGGILLSTAGPEETCYAAVKREWERRS